MNKNNNTRKNNTPNFNAPNVDQNIFNNNNNNINLPAIATVIHHEIDTLCAEMKTHFPKYGANDSDIDENGTSKIIAIDVRCAPNLFAIILRSLFSRDVSRVVDRSPSIQTKLRYYMPYVFTSITY
jgi:hypothetical protein